MYVKEVPRFLLDLPEEPFHAHIPVNNNRLLRGDMCQVVSLCHDRPQAGDKKLHHNGKKTGQDGDISSRDKAAFHIEDQIRYAKRQKLGEYGFPNGILRHLIRPVYPHKPAVDRIVKQERYEPACQAVGAERK